MLQSQALSILKTGGNVFLTGEPGAGKTYILNEYVDWLLDCGVKVAITASTGIAATHIGGMTIHSWSGIGARDTLSPYDLDAIVNKEHIAKRIRQAQVLVIDEISMLDGRMLDLVDKVCKAVRQRGEAFGGLQTILVGDFFQLPPITRMGEMPRFAFESNAWQSAGFLTCYLTEQHRQEDDLLLSLLSSIRKNEIEEEHYTLLSEQTEISFPNIEPTRLFTHNKDVDALNMSRLRELKTKGKTFKMEGRGNKIVIEGLKKNCLSPELLELREEAMVMCTKNNFEAGYVNGTLGRIVGFDSMDGYPIIETSDGKKITIEPTEWRVEENGKSVAEITQIPLRLAWAITVHKSQGMSLDAAEIDLRNAFAYGQGYVALSRVRTLGGMKVIGINGNALTVDPKIVLMDEKFRIESESTEDAFEEMDEGELMKMHENFIKASGGKIPEEGANTEKRQVTERIKKNATHLETLLFLEKGLTIPQIAKERQMAVSTIWTHVEKCSEEGKVRKEMAGALVPSSLPWEKVYPEFVSAFKKHGIEKLKPVYEALGEAYDYDVVRAARLIYSLDK